MNRYFTTLLGCAVAASLLSGCVSIAARVIDTVYSDPRTKNHAYYATVKLSFALGEKKIVATRYAEAWYLTGGTSSPWFPCDQAKPSCWFITNHFFVGLPNGDIVDIFVDPSSLSLANMTVDQPVHVVGSFTGIYRDQRDTAAAKEFGPCFRLNEEILQRDYSLPPHKGVESQIAIAVDVTKGQGASSKNLVFAPDEFYQSAIFDGVRCSRLIRRIKGQTAIDPR